MLWLARHNPEIDWKTGEVKMTRCPEECRKQWRPVQGKSGWEKQKEEEAREEKEERREKKKKKKKKVFTKMDLRWEYNNVRIKKGDEWKAAFTTPEGSFEPTVMFFGLTNSPATFQAMMNELLRDLTNTGEVAVFIDDVIIGTEMEERHDELVAEVIRRLEENDLYVKPEKCKWRVKEVEFLGVVIGLEGIKMEKEKIKGVVEWPIPKSVKEIQKFLGLANFYRRFIEGFATVAKPLHDLVKKDKKWEWTDRQEEAFRELKKRFTEEPVLAAPDIDKKMRMEVDVSDYATGGYYQWNVGMVCGDQ